MEEIIMYWIVIWSFILLTSIIAISSDIYIDMSENKIHLWIQNAASTGIHNTYEPNLENNNIFKGIHLKI